MPAKPTKKHKHSPSPSNGSANSQGLSQGQGQGQGQVRIIAGRYGRRYIEFYDAEGLRPTPDRLRETLFNWLMHDLYDAYVLDACAGSGILGFEALSRGARYCVFVEVGKTQIHSLSANASRLGLDASQFCLVQRPAEQLNINDLPSQHGINPSVATLNSANPNGINDNLIHTNHGQLTDNGNVAQHSAVFDLVFIDPPYALNLWTAILDNLLQLGLINAQTLIYAEDARPIADTLKPFNTPYQILKSTKVGAVHASLIQLMI